MLPVNIVTSGGTHHLMIFLACQPGVSAALVPAVKVLAGPARVLVSSFVLQYPGRKGDIYNILWILVFGFATLNILGLVARRFEPDRTRLNFGELLAVMVVVLSIGLLAWEILGLLHIFPIQLKPR